MRRAVLIAAVAAVGIVMTLLSTVPAAAHAELISTDPSEGQVLDEAPAHLTLTFNERVHLSEGGIVVLRADGSTVDTVASAADSQVAIDLPPGVADGTYIVNWRVVSEDSHPVVGAFTFSIGAPSDVTVEAGAHASTWSLDVVKATLQAAIYMGIFLTTGLTVFELVLLAASRGAMPILRRRMRRTTRISAAVAAVALIAILPVTAAQQAGEGVRAILDPGLVKSGLLSTSGLASVIALVGLALVGILSRRLDQLRPGFIAAVHVGIALTLGSLVLVGHTRTFGPMSLMWISDFMHVIAGSVWFGGLVGITMMLSPGADTSDRRAARTVARFSAVAAWLLLAVALTGLFLGWRILGSLELLFNTWYGRTLLVKLALVLAVVGAAGWNRFRLVPQIEKRVEGTGLRALRRIVGIEAALLAGALIVTGALVSQSPLQASRGTEATGTTGGTEPEAVDTVLGDGQIMAHISPGRIGTNSVHLTLLDRDGQPLTPMSDPIVELSLPQAGVGPLAGSVVATGPGEYEADINLPLAGNWEMEVSVRISKFANPIAVIALEIQP